MTAVRLSPSGSLLRSSRLFALPPAIHGPKQGDFGSDTATTAHPLRAALETPLVSLNRGDWGLKRHLPTKTTTKSGTPTFRIKNGIDTADHVTDFESAADHVLTLRKFQELNIRTVFPVKDDRFKPRLVSVFTPELDNTTDTPFQIDVQAKSSSQLPAHLQASLEQFEKDQTDSAEPQVQPVDLASSNLDPEAPRRWRFAGPYLAGISELEFNAFLEKITPQKLKEFKALVKSELTRIRTQEKRYELVAQGRADEQADATVEIGDEDVEQYLKTLRSDTAKFGPLIAQFFDLADGPRPVGVEDWPYGRQTFAAEQYRESGPPALHPSAGLTYHQAVNYTINDIKNGPLVGNRAFPARILNSYNITNDIIQPVVGVAGFVARLREKSFRKRSMAWAAEKGGKKTVVSPKYVTLKEDGRVQLTATVMDDWVLENDEPVPKSESESARRPDILPAAAVNRSSRMPQQDRRRRVVIDQSIVNHQA
ncbi:hypothetical protein B0A52_09319 [Exophiala mesophila]|uniref:Uncharacterized protein n=1 Tax=Exophiala mesophila TaxID=212818 RepID=A0A438MWH6_EXOME|nr:hypothetical protein B0A52_09319 [Exophiala mesophila]